MVEFASIKDSVFRERATTSTYGDMLYNSQLLSPVEVVKNLRQYQLMLWVSLARACIHSAVLVQFRCKVRKLLAYVRFDLLCKLLYLIKF